MFSFLSGLSFRDETWWFLSLRVYGLLSSSSLLFPQRFGRFVLQPSSGVCRTREPSRNFELRALLNPRGSSVLIPLAITGYVLYWIHGGLHRHVRWFIIRANFWFSFSNCFHSFIISGPYRLDISCLNFWDEAWFLSLRVFGLLSSFLLLFPQRFDRYVLRPSSGTFFLCLMAYQPSRVI